MLPKNNIYLIFETFINSNKKNYFKHFVLEISTREKALANRFKNQHLTDQIIELRDAFID